MKFNFWQWIGIALLLAGVAWWIYDRQHPKAPAPTNPTTAVVR